jgi:tRNA-dihydrouridine synthase C
VELGAQAIDINFGCPAPTVNRHDGGATLLKYPTRIRAIVGAVRAALPKEIPVSAKLRLGWDSLDAIHENAAMAAEGGAAWLAIHGRTRVAGYAPPAYWKPIGEVKRRLGLPVIANGDIWTIEDFRRCREESDCEHFMLGRGALADPFLPLNIAGELGIAFRAPTDFSPGTSFPRERASWSGLFGRFAAATGERPHRSQMLARRCKQWLKMAAMHRPVDWFDDIKVLQTFEEIQSAITL